MVKKDGLGRGALSYLINSLVAVQEQQLDPSAPGPSTTQRMTISLLTQPILDLGVDSRSHALNTQVSQLGFVSNRGITWEDFKRLGFPS